MADLEILESGSQQKQELAEELLLFAVYLQGAVEIIDPDGADSLALHLLAGGFGGRQLAQTQLRKEARLGSHPLNGALLALLEGQIRK